MRYRIFLILIGTIILSGCSKDFLEKTPDKALSVPTTLEDLRALMDNDDMFSNIPGLTDLGCDDYSLSYSDWLTKEQTWRNAYTWEEDVFQGLNSNDWTQAYNQIYVCNVVLESLEDVRFKNNDDDDLYNDIKGNALLYRALYHFSLQETFGQPYRPTSAEIDLGIPVRINTALEANTPVSSVSQTFDSILDDLLNAVKYLPSEMPVFSLRYKGSKAAAFALLARVALVMQDYEKANQYAENCLKLNDYLVDYNILNTNSARPFGNIANDEILLLCYQVPRNLSFSSSTFISEDLLESYSHEDLRKSIFYQYNPATESYFFKGQYTGNLFAFGGIANDEVYLIRAEANARLGNFDLAISDFDFFRSKRMIQGSVIIPVKLEQLLDSILMERRKELIFRGNRWSDLRRFNQEQELEVTLSRNLNDINFILPPNDKRYTYPFPPNELKVRGF